MAEPKRLTQADGSRRFNIDYSQILNIHLGGWTGREVARSSDEEEPSPEGERDKE